MRSLTRRSTRSKKTWERGGIEKRVTRGASGLVIGGPRSVAFWRQATKDKERWRGDRGPRRDSLSLYDVLSIALL